MRNAFLETLLEIAEDDTRVWLLCGDLGYSVLEPFRERFPDRFINVGVAEQNMMGIASGLALDGNVVFCYSIANFSTLRCLEQIRNDVCGHDCDVKIVSVGGGVAYGSLGYSHHALEDMALMRALPGMVVAAPGDLMEVRAATRVLAEHSGPCYLRLGKAGEPALHGSVPTVEVGKALPMREGDDVILLSTGGMLENALQAADLLDRSGISTGVVSVPFVKPLDAAYVAAAVQRAKLLCTIEEHGPFGGLGDAVSSCVARMPGARARLLTLNLAEGSTMGVAGGQDWFRMRGGLDAFGIAAAVADALGKALTRFPDAAQS